LEQNYAITDAPKSLDLNSNMLGRWIKEDNVLCNIKAVLTDDDIIASEYKEDSDKSNTMLWLNERSALIAMPFMAIILSMHLPHLKSS